MMGKGGPMKEENIRVFSGSSWRSSRNSEVTSFPSFHGLMFPVIVAVRCLQPWRGLDSIIKLGSTQFGFSMEEYTKDFSQVIF
jgi:hypothetical protein